MPSSQDLENEGKINVEIFKPANEDGLKNIIIIIDSNLNNIDVEEGQIMLPLPHLLWILGKCIKNPIISGWTAVLLNITKNKLFSQSRIINYASVC